MMSDTGSMISIVDSKHELGMVICKVCNKVVDTLPTNGVTKIYGVCKDIECILKATGSDRR
jgi:hypothetical protein